MRLKVLLRHARQSQKTIPAFTAVAFLSGFLTALWLGDHSVADSSAYRILRDSVIFAGTAIALWIAYGRAQAHLRQAKAQTSAIDKQTKQIQLSHREQLTSRFTEGVRQLGDSSLTIRLGGIAALWSVVEETDKQEDRHMVFDVLCAFIRQSTHDSPKGQTALSEENNVATASASQTVCPDVALAFRKMTAASDDYHPPLWENYQRDFRGAQLQSIEAANRDLKKTLIDRADFSRADLRGSDLSDCNARSVKFVGSCMDSAALEGADLEQSDFSNATASNTRFTNSNLTGAIFDKTNLSESSMSGANLTAACFPRTNLSMANLLDCETLAVDFSDAYYYEGRSPQLERGLMERLHMKRQLEFLDN